MTRGTLTTNIIALAFLTLAPAAFSAAVVHTGTLTVLNATASGRGILQRDIDRLRAGTKMDVIAVPLSLGAVRPGSSHTLTGICTDTGASDVTLADTPAETASHDEKTCPALAANAGVAAAPAPALAASENVGSSSAFGAPLAAQPEPSSAVLLALGAASLLHRRRRN